MVPLEFQGWTLLPLGKAVSSWITDTFGDPMNKHLCLNMIHREKKYWTLFFLSCQCNVWCQPIVPQCHLVTVSALLHLFTTCRPGVWHHVFSLDADIRASHWLLWPRSAVGYSETFSDIGAKPNLYCEAYSLGVGEVWWMFSDPRVYSQVMFCTKQIFLYF